MPHKHNVTIRKLVTGWGRMEPAMDWARERGISIDTVWQAEIGRVNDATGTPAFAATVLARADARAIDTHRARYRERPLRPALADGRVRLDFLGLGADE